jgi:hypothetical protein
MVRQRDSKQCHTRRRAGPRPSSAGGIGAPARPAAASRDAGHRLGRRRAWRVKRFRAPCGAGSGNAPASGASTASTRMRLRALRSRVSMFCPARWARGTLGRTQGATPVSLLFGRHFTRSMGERRGLVSRLLPAPRDVGCAASRDGWETDKRPVRAGDVAGRFPTADSHAERRQ